MGELKTQGHKKAWEMVNMAPVQGHRMMALNGGAGTGKTTFIKYLWENYQRVVSFNRGMGLENFPNMLILTATTHKAVEAITEKIPGVQVQTIQSLLGLKVNTNYKTGETSLEQSRLSIPLSNCFVVIDESSMIDSNLLSNIQELLIDKSKNTYVLFVGDKDQILAVKSQKAIVEYLDIPKTHLDEVLRQDNSEKLHPITELAELFRKMVVTGEEFQYSPNQVEVKHLSRDDFNKAVKNEFTKPQWDPNDSVVLSWRNKTVEEYNQFIWSSLKRSPYEPGSYVISNKYVNYQGSPTNPYKYTIRNNEVIHITSLSFKQINILGENVEGYVINGTIWVPQDKEYIKVLIKKAQKEDVYQLPFLRSIPDLRYPFSRTVDKSQGSTFNKVFVDISDISRCNDFNRVARMLYVACSRARYELILTGDLA